MAAPPSEQALPYRPQQWVRPSDGRPVHIASNPDHAETLRRQLTNTHGTDESFDVFIKGSEEHVKALQEAHAFQETRLNDLRKTNPEVWRDFERVRQDLDHLSAELGGLTTQNVSLDASFGRFGYSANIKTLTDDDAASTSGLSRTTSARSEPGERTIGETIKLYRRPVVRQYFHKGLIWRASEEAQVTAMELFVDLIFVGLIAVMGDTAADEPTGESLLRFCITLILSYNLWTSLTTYNAWFVSNDLYQRAAIVFFTACLVGYSTNVQMAFDSTYTELIAFYLAGRIFLLINYFAMFFLVPMLQFFFVAASIIIVIPVVLFIASIHVEYPTRLALIWIAIIVDLYGNVVIVPLHRQAHQLENTFLAPLARRAQFYPAINIEHRTERMNAFVTLVIGYSVVALLFQSQSPSGINAYYGKAVLGLLIAVVFSLIYFEIDSSNLYVHAIRRHAVAFAVWQNAHLPFVLSFTLASGALAKLVVAHDCPNTDLDALAPYSAPKSVEEIEPGLRWFFCGGIGVALACTVAISASHDHKKTPTLRFAKRTRLIIRSLCSLVIIVLPTAEDRLNSLDLLAVVTSLLVLSLLVELWGCSCSSQGSFWGDNRCCNYATECRVSKKDLEALRNGEVSGVEELARRRRQKSKEKEQGSGYCLS